MTRCLTLIPTIGYWMWQFFRGLLQVYLSKKFNLMIFLHLSGEKVSNLFKKLCSNNISKQNCSGRSGGRFWQIDSSNGSFCNQFIPDIKTKTLNIKSYKAKLIIKLFSSSLVGFHNLEMQST